MGKISDLGSFTPKVKWPRGVLKRKRPRFDEIRGSIWKVITV